MDKAFSLEALPPTVHTELNRLCQNKVTGADLLARLTELYRAFGLGAYRDASQLPSGEAVELPFPRIVCSEALL